MGGVASAQSSRDEPSLSVTWSCCWFGDRFFRLRTGDSSTVGISSGSCCWCICFMGRGVIFRDRLVMDELSAKYVLVSLMLLSLPPRTLVFNTVFFDLSRFEPIVSGVTRDVWGFCKRWPLGCTGCCGRWSGCVPAWEGMGGGDEVKDQQPKRIHPSESSRSMLLTKTWTIWKVG